MARLPKIFDPYCCIYCSGAPFRSSALMLSKEVSSFIQTPLADKRIFQTGGDS